MGTTVNPPTDLEIRTAIANLITETLEEFYGVPNTARVHNHWILAHVLGESAGLLRPTEGPFKGLIHAWMVGLSAVSRKRPEPSNTMQGAHRLRNTNPNRRDILRSYRVWCYHNLDTGETIENEDETNSDTRLANEIEAVTDAFSKKPLLGIDNPKLMGHEELQFSPIDSFRFGEARANVAQGSLSVRIQKSLDLNQY